MMDWVALLVRWRVIFPQVEDQLPHEFQEHVTMTQGPAKYVQSNVEFYCQCDGLRVYSGTPLIQSPTGHGVDVLKRFFKQEIDWLSLFGP